MYTVKKKWRKLIRGCCNHFNWIVENNKPRLIVRLAYFTNVFVYVYRLFVFLFCIPLFFTVLSFYVLLLFSLKYWGCAPRHWRRIPTSLYFVNKRTNKVSMMPYPVFPMKVVIRNGRIHATVEFPLKKNTQMK